MRTRNALFYCDLMKLKDPEEIVYLMDKFFRELNDIKDQKKWEEKDVLEALRFMARWLDRVEDL